MIYKIIVDKQPMTNPSADKKEYEIDIAPLYFKHDVYDSLVITHDEDYVMRRLELQDYNVLVELDPPVKEPLTNINIELFEGENYIYLYDMAGNKIVAQYLVKNEFNELYVLESTMNSAITQSANAIELYVQQNYETLSHATSEYARIDLNAQGISTEVASKVGNNEVISKINQSAEQVTINANKISLAGKTINMTSDDIAINSTNFSVDKNGNMSCTNANVSGTISSSNATITNGKVVVKGTSASTDLLRAESTSNQNEWSYMAPSVGTFNGQSGYVAINAKTTNFYTSSVDATDENVGFAALHGNGEVVIRNKSIDARGRAMFGRDNSSHHYTCNWTGSDLDFWVDTTNVGTLSDKRLKTDIEDIDKDFINAIKEVEMKQFKVANRNGLVSFGILAQDLMEIFKKYNKNPLDYEIVQETKYKSDDDTVYYKINYEQFLVLKAKAQELEIKELQEKDRQKDEIIQDLISRIEKLEKGDK